VPLTTAASVNVVALVNDSLWYPVPDTVDRYTTYPITGDGLAFHDSIAEWAETKVPVPESPTTGFPVVAFVKKVTVPADVPAADAEYEIVNACAAFTGIVTGNAVESIANPDPVTIALLTVSGVLPVL
jgi:hypothetical protein